jgi:hypothetical protein
MMKRRDLKQITAGHCPAMTIPVIWAKLPLAPENGPSVSARGALSPWILALRVDLGRAIPYKPANLPSTRFCRGRDGVFS